MAGDHTLCIRFAFHEYTVELIKWSGPQGQMGCFQKTTPGQDGGGGVSCHGLVFD